MEDEISNVFNVWVQNLNKPRKLTKRRIKAIQDALKIVSEKEIILVIEYIFNSDDEYASFVRGNNKAETKYTGLLNLLRIKKIEDKVKRAKLWKSSFELPEDDFGWEIK